MPEKQDTFEKNLKQLEDVVARLEQGDLPLDEAMKLFQEGMRLSRLCSQRLSTVEQEIKKLVAEGDKLKLETFEPDTNA
ncbi:MAG: exodeoxyribonuclease VII small subunit [candidate division Zixibacteria bacterium]|nr:exodeoxyribonuclease VII small subunit [candidate division Zixibacteria bacterium]